MSVTPLGSTPGGAFASRLSVGAIVTESLRHYAAQPGTLLLLALLFQGPAYLALSQFTSVAVDALARVAQTDTTGAVVCGALAASLPLMAGAMVSGGLYVALAAAITVAIVRVKEVGVSRVPAVLALTARRMRPLAGGTLLALAVVALILGLPLAVLGYVDGCWGGGDDAGLAAAIRRVSDEALRNTVGRGLLWLAVCGGIGYVVNAAVRWVVMPQVAVLEGGSPSAVLWRSRYLVRGHWLRVALILLSLLIVQSGMAAVLGVPLSLVLGVLPWDLRPSISLLATAIAQVVAAPISGVGATLLYVALRNMSDGALPETPVGSGVTGAESG